MGSMHRELAMRCPPTGILLRIRSIGKRLFFRTAPMIDQLLKFFITFLVVVEPIGVIPIFVAMTSGDTEAARRRMARKGVAIAGLIFLLFALGGGAFLRTMNISLDAF